MAWEYVDLPETGTYGYSNILDWSVGLTLDPITSTYVSGYDLTLGDGMLNAESDAKSNTTSYGLTVYWYSRNSKITGYDVYANGTRVAGLSGGMDKATMRFAINRETQDAKVVSMDIYRNTMYGNTSTSIYNYSVTDYASRKVLYDLIVGQVPLITVSNGGGATHIAKRSGKLKDLSSYLSDVLIVSGGGGGGQLVNTTTYAGADAGGISGNGSNSANQSVGYGFGLGENGVSISPPAEYSYLRKINTLVYNGAPDFLTSEYVLMRADGWTWYPDFSDYDSCSYYSNHWILHYGEYSTGGQWYQSLCPLTGILRIDYNTRTKTATYSNANFRTALWTYTGYSSGIAEGNTIYDFRLYYGTPPDWSFSNWGTENYSFTTSFASTSEAMSYFYSHFANVDLYVDGAPWVVVGR